MLKVQRQAMQDQIAYFGQTPSQLLTIPHMKRKPLAEVLHLQVIYIKPWLLRTTPKANDSKHFFEQNQIIPPWMRSIVK